ncbi:hypothetical protein SAMN05444411_1211 [Lutibacter oricola]|uniref:Lipoprotein n=1 Tax=Lutibacter oricola TaxID=762486 RepID=A0A1H3H0Z9_9FLAO|nr:hypothetical protein [Lutibacter oricola]SDY08309.1 hypothetical protein SAMN05444411_1211 [Lutibacter oricola]
MKKIILFLFLILLISCKNDSQKKNIDKIENEEFTKVKIEKVNDSKKNEQKDEEINLINFNIEYIKSKTSKLTENINVDSINIKELNKIPKEFLKKYISSHKIDFGYPEYLPVDYPESYSFYQFKEFENFFLFTIIHQNEFCCQTLYAVTTEKNEISIINISVIGFVGADGGWKGKRFGKWFNEFGIGSTLINFYDEDLDENTKNVEIDSTWSEYEFSKNGIIKNIEHHQVKYKGNKQIE